MAASSYTKLKHVTRVSDTDLLTEIETNLKYYLDWGLLGAGGWIDVEVSQTGIEGGIESTLKYVEDPSYNNGQVFQGFRKDWVWETGVEYDDTGTNPDPISITGIQVGTGIYASGDTNYGWHINYPLGRVIFNSAIPTGSTVKADYSYRWCQTYVADDAPWFRELQYKSFDASETQFIQQDKIGDWSICGHQRVQMPSVIIECVAKGGGEGYELGSNALNRQQDVLLNVIAENRQDRNKLVDYFLNLKDKVIWLFDSDLMVEQTGFPLDYRGMLVGSKMYPDLVAATGDDGFRWKKCYIVDSNSSEIESWSPNLHEGVVRLSLEVVVGDT
jgi:hypothetical protein